MNGHGVAWRGLAAHTNAAVGGGGDVHMYEEQRALLLITTNIINQSGTRRRVSVGRARVSSVVRLQTRHRDVCERGGRRMNQLPA